MSAVKGDRVEVVVELGAGETRTYEIVATRAGRRVETTNGRGVVEVTDPTAFLSRLAQGFGSAKAFGNGLMLIRRA